MPALHKATVFEAVSLNFEIKKVTPTDGEADHK